MIFDSNFEETMSTKEKVLNIFQDIVTKLWTNMEAFNHEVMVDKCKICNVHTLHKHANFFHELSEEQRKSFIIHKFDGETKPGKVEYISK